MTIAEELARRVAAATYEDLPEEAIYWAKVALLDTLGVTLAGSQEDCARIVDTVLGTAPAPGPSLVLGRGRRAGALDAALINGTASHALDYDDCSDTLGGHPSAPILPALLALAEAEGATGRDVLVAYVVGWEVETAVSKAVNFEHYLKGWHPTATLGAFGAAAACAKLLRLPEDRTAVALALAASFAAGIKSNFGTMTKPLHVGQTTRNGLWAALLAREGFTANPMALEAKQGFFDVFNGPGKYDAAHMFDTWGRPWDIVSPGVSIKAYPCCGSTHSSIDAMLELTRRHGLTPDNVAKVETRVHLRRLLHTDRPQVDSVLAAKFSQQYVMARALLNGEVILEHFEGDAYRDPAVQALLPRFSAAAIDAKTDDGEPVMEGGQTDAEVTVTTTDGRTHFLHVARPLGRGPDHPLPNDRLEAKFADCAARAIPGDAVPRVIAAVQNIDALPAIADLTRLLEPAGGVA